MYESADPIQAEIRPAEPPTFDPMQAVDSWSDLDQRIEIWARMDTEEFDANVGAMSVEALRTAINQAQIAQNEHDARARRAAQLEDRIRTVGTFLAEYNSRAVAAADAVVSSLR